MIIQLYEYAPLFVWIVLIGVLYFYKLDKLYPTIMNDLIQREAKGEL